MRGDHYSSPLNPLLRKAPNGIARSAYAVEINPWARKGEIEATLLFRGTIISAFGYIETRLGDLAIRCSRLDQYAALRDSFPHSTEKRVAFLRRAFALAPLVPYQRYATLFLNRVEQAAGLRHMVAHSRMQVLPNWGVTFHDIPKAGPGSITKRSHRLTLDQLELEAWKSARLSRLCQTLMDRLDAAGVVPLE